MDAAMVLATCHRRVSYLMAEASWKRWLVGQLAWCLDVIPVKRAQDDAKPGTGTVRFLQSTTCAVQDDRNGIIVHVFGTNTLFRTELKVNDKIRPANTAVAVKVIQIHSDTQLTIEASGLADEYFDSDRGTPEKDYAYDILGYTPLHEVFAKVLDRLAAGGIVGTLIHH
jgi:glycerol-3-phosphate O-acyltransferase/dihydroxyacetone phosphate acyltransferase